MLTNNLWLVFFSHVDVAPWFFYSSHIHMKSTIYALLLAKWSEFCFCFSF